MEQFYEQVRESHIMILTHCTQKSNPSALDIETRIDGNGHLIVKNAKPDSEKLSYQNYFFDYITLLGHLTQLFTHLPILVRSMLRHKEGRTFNFIIRNIYFLMTMTVNDVTGNAPPAQKEYRIWFSNSMFNKKRVETVNEFFKRAMFDNPHLTLNERRAKQDARIIFQKELLRNLTRNAGPSHEAAAQYPLWPQLKTVFNIGALWLMSIVLKEEDKEDLLHTQQV
jgi:hypothetical protein